MTLKPRLSGLYGAFGTAAASLDYLDYPENTAKAGCVDEQSEAE